MVSNVIKTSKIMRSKVISHTIVMLFCLYSMQNDLFTQKKADFIQDQLKEVFFPFQKKIAEFRYFLQSQYLYYVHLQNVQKENQKIKQELQRLKSQLTSLEEFKEENQRLKKLLKFGENLPYQKVLARVIRSDSSGTFKILVIDKGLSDGVIDHSVVITDLGIVGFILKSYSSHSDVLTILDPNHKVSAFLQKPRTSGIIQGNSKNLLMKYVRQKKVISKGTVAITSGMGMFYPKGLPIGEVLIAERNDYDVEQQVTIAPFVDIAEIEEVIILLPAPKNKKES